MMKAEKYILPLFLETQKGVGDDFLQLPFTYYFLLFTYLFFPNFFIKTS